MTSCPLARRSGKLETSVVAEVHAFLEQVEHQYGAALAAIRNHPFVQGVEQGTVPLAIPSPPCFPDSPTGDFYPDNVFYRDRKQAQKPVGAFEKSGLFVAVPLSQ